MPRPPKSQNHLNFKTVLYFKIIVHSLDCKEQCSRLYVDKGAVRTDLYFFIFLSCKSKPVISSVHNRWVAYVIPRLH